MGSPRRSQRHPAKTTILAAIATAALNVGADVNPCIQPSTRPTELTVHYLGSVSGCAEWNGRHCYRSELIDFWIDVDPETMLLECDQIVWQWDNASAVVKAPVTVRVAWLFANDGVHSVFARLQFGNRFAGGTAEMFIYGDMPPPGVKPRRRAVRK